MINWHYISAQKVVLPFCRPYANSFFKHSCTKDMFSSSVNHTSLTPFKFDFILVFSIINAAEVKNSVKERTIDWYEKRAESVNILNEVRDLEEWKEGSEVVNQINCLISDSVKTEKGLWQSEMLIWKLFWDIFIGLLYIITA